MSFDNKTSDSCLLVSFLIFDDGIGGANSHLLYCISSTSAFLKLNILYLRHAFMCLEFQLPLMKAYRYTLLDTHSIGSMSPS